ncbi:5-oxoprolinase subunit PxpB [Pontixanthobacter gangjinensis]|uniref:5-oxoprolinase subunit PxpB n=1 Tax=Christiangramia aestuarii TaxID=1028746 RepID=A0A7M3SX31_9FLAO|nr:5-oxoprolinase subunit PxpB [Christiangramia aestuarii]MUP41162.1 5-oxoprolinase subunit PxpB [Christiangramia aestuarii]
MAEFPKISPLGDRGILVKFGGDISENLLEEVLYYKNILENSEFKQKVEVVNTYTSLLISYMFTIEDVYGEVLRVKRLVSGANIPKNNKYKIFSLPVCYDEEFGLDLQHISEQNNLSIEEIIQLHTAAEYRIYFTGFLPGFLYLGGLDEKLKISRKKSPRKSVEKGSVGIGENQTGIYPKNSPGGWQILGKCPVELFNKNEAIPSPFSAGDKIKFEAISKEDFYKIRDEVQSGNYSLKYHEHEG